jgi:hypothetical protein
VLNLLGDLMPDALSCLRWASVQSWRGAVWRGESRLGLAGHGLAGERGGFGPSLIAATMAISH